ncbi:MFS transporter [Paraburkholderia phenoliruptrix]|uniref:Major facilitator superfamily protein n=2 Tax=Paraburkholderia phenoliruptrix TaxID=252970 RepID=K0DZ07_9BURK|nr:MFS transporter [Paraburkholderia phenoliruptrix]AFT89857.1 major facilitator superfamily protein [Paraburkholderia phenoliruptrix BR3459a]MDR6417790.1 putative MFS family arabinose efflux permease [Paraburkholderia phenoliruptrix]CAB4046462.1 putative transporter [Paraburkholderia phenoliruptrix]
MLLQRPERTNNKEMAVPGSTTVIDSPAPPPLASRGKIMMMAIIAGAVITNLYCTQPVLPLIATDLGVDATTVDLVAGAGLLGFSGGLALLLPLGDRFDRRKLVLVQIALAIVFGIAAAVAPGIWALVAAAFGLGAVSCVPQQLVPFAAAMSLPTERGRNVGTVVSGIMIGILAGRTVAGAIGAAYGWRAVYGFEAAFMVPVGIAAASLLPRGVPSTNLSYGRLLASLWPLARDNRPIRESMIIQALLWACFNAFWVNLAALLASGPWHLGSAWAGGFGIIGAAGALAASLGGNATDRIGFRKVIGASIGTVTLSYVLLSGAATSLTLLIVGVIVLDVGVQSGLVSNQTRAFAVDPKAQGRINSLYMTATFFGGAVGATVSGWLLTRFGWNGIVVFGIVLGVLASAIHWFGAPRAAATEAQANPD